VAQAFDPDRLETKGDFLSFPTATNASSVRWFTVSSNGLLAYEAQAAVKSRLVWKDQQGKVLGSLGEPKGQMSEIALAPDGRHVAMTIDDPGEDGILGRSSLWIYDTVPGIPVRFTLASSGSPVWSPDGATVYFGAKHGLFRRASNGTGAEEQLLNDPVPQAPIGISPDGKFCSLKARGYKQG